MQRSLFQSHHLLGKVFPFLELILGKVSAYIIPELGVNCILFRFSSDSSALFTPGWLPRAMLKTCYGGSIRSQIEAYASFKATSENSQSIVRKNTACIYIITYVYIYIFYLFVESKNKNKHVYVCIYFCFHASELYNLSSPPTIFGICNPKDVNSRYWFTPINHIVSVLLYLFCLQAWIFQTNVTKDTDVSQIPNSLHVAREWRKHRWHLLPGIKSGFKETCWTEQLVILEYFTKMWWIKC